MFVDYILDNSPYFFISFCIEQSIHDNTVSQQLAKASEAYIYRIYIHLHCGHS